MVSPLSRRLAPAAFAFQSLTLVAAALLGEDARASTPAAATTPISALDPSDASCSRVSADVARWSPAGGPPARFVADAFVAGWHGGLWVGLGYTDTGFWSAEAHADDDACDGCDSLDVVLTGFDGKRHRFPVITPADQARLAGSPTESLKDLALARLWHLAATDWPAGRLLHDYRLRYAPNRDAEGLSAPYPGWMAEASVRGKGLLRFALRVEGHVACSCVFGWRGWELAAPRGR